ncbi:MAG: glycosyltransferase family 1 protein [Cyclobacteriaceae bacterium]
MRIGFDAKRAFYNSRGLGNYSRNLITGLTKFFPDNLYVGYSPKLKSGLVSANDASQFNQVRHDRHFLPAWWRSVGISNEITHDRLDIYHGLSGELPLQNGGNAKMVVTIHDFNWHVVPQNYPFIDRKIYQWKALQAIKRADRVIAVSEWTKRSLLAFYPPAKEKTTVISPSISEEWFENSSIELKLKVKEKFQLPDHFMLYVGALEKYKNIQLIINSLKDSEVSLVIVGTGTYEVELKKQTAEAKLSDRILFINEIDNPSAEEIRCIYSLAMATILPSLSEGFGIPVIESLACKTPALVANTTSLPEVVGPGGLLFEVNNVQSLTNCINQIVSDSVLRDDLSKRGYEHAKNYSSETASGKLIELYKECVESKIST